MITIPVTDEEYRAGEINSLVSFKDKQYVQLHALHHSDDGPQCSFKISYTKKTLLKYFYSK